MNEELFVNALTSLLIVSDYVELLETGRSFIVEKMCELGSSREEAIFTVLSFGKDEEPVTCRYLSEIERLGLEDEFERWSDQTEVIRERKQSILQTISTGLNALNHPHRFH